MLWQQHEGIDVGVVERIHDGGGQVIAWTVNTTEDASRLAGLGVDGLCGNHIDRLRVAARGSIEA
jgi:glycerophosphoryl diester phosphodiesterase